MQSFQNIWDLGFIWRAQSAMEKLNGDTGVCRLGRHYVWTYRSWEWSVNCRCLFLVIEEALKQTILGFNAIKILVNKSENTSVIINSLTNNLVNTNRSNVSILVHLISTSSDNDDIPVRAMSNTTIILAFSEKRTSVTPWYAHVRVRISG